MDDMSLLNDRNNSIVEFASIRGNLTEKEIDQNLCTNGNDKQNDSGGGGGSGGSGGAGAGAGASASAGGSIRTDEIQYKTGTKDTAESMANFGLSKANSIIIITNTSADNFLSSTAVKDGFLSEDDEFDLEKIKKESLTPINNVNCNMNSEDFFKKEDSLDLSYDCSDLNINNGSFEMQNSPFQSTDMFMHEEVFTENIKESEENQNTNLPLNNINTELKQEENYDDAKYCSVLSDHNYISQEINVVNPYFIIRNSDDFKHCTSILKSYLTQHENNRKPSSELSETEKILHEFSDHLNAYKKTLNFSEKIQKCAKQVDEKINTELPSNDIKPDIKTDIELGKENDTKVGKENDIEELDKESDIEELDKESDTESLAETMKNFEITVKAILDSSSSDIEMEPLRLSENCSEPLEFDDKLSNILQNSQTDKSPTVSISNEDISEMSDLKSDIESVNENIEHREILNKLKDFGQSIIERCVNLKKTTEQDINNLITEKLMELKELRLIGNYNSVSVQTDNTGKQYSEKRLRKMNEHEKLRLLQDSSSSYGNYSDDEDDIDLYGGDSDGNRSASVHSKCSLDKNDDNFMESLKGSQTDSVKDIEFMENDEAANLEESNCVENDEEPENITVECDVNINSMDGMDDFIPNTSPQLTKDEINDREISRLLDFKQLANTKVSTQQYVGSSRELEKSSSKCLKKNTDNLLDILNGSKDDSSDESNTEADTKTTNEKDFLTNRNSTFKQQLIGDISSSDISGSSEPAEPIEEPVVVEKESEDSNTSTVGKFLETYNVDDDEDDANGGGGGASSGGDGKVIASDALDKSIINDSPKSKSIERKMSSDVEEIIFDDSLSKTDQNKDADTEKSGKENEPEPEPDKIIEIDNNSSPEKSPNTTTTSIFDKAFEKRKTKEKSFETMLKEDTNRRENIKINDELISLSSDDTDVEESAIEKETHNRMLRPMIRQEQLASETKVAQKEEHGRILRLKKKETILKKAFKEHKKDRSDIKELILDYHNKNKTFIKVHPDLLQQLKQHQIDGVKFMYDACYGSVNFINEHPGSGCILAHCMGLGKTLQLITLLHTVITYKELKTSKVLVLCPKSTVMNWADEIQRWLGPLKTSNLKIFTFSDTSDVKNKLSVLQEWANSGKIGYRNCGFLLIGYEAFRTLVSYHTYKKRSSSLTQSDIDAIQKTVKETLLHPGADLVVCDEGHIIKNRKAAISQAVTEIRTTRRIILTGTPIQNNLKEYYSMVNFIKPSFLGTEKEFANLYANPICNGQHKDSSKLDIKIMKQRSFVLHKKLSSFVQRREAALLKTFLPQKFEYVLFIPLSTVQTKLYEIFLVSVSKREDSKGRNLLTDYTCLRKIWTHPKVLENAWLNATMSKQRKENKRNANLIIQTDDEEPDDIYDSQIGFMSVTSDWWRQHLTQSDLESILPSNKIQAMFEILRMCKENREKCLIFSAFVAVLNVVEYFMELIHKNESNPSTKELGIDKYIGPWVLGKDYYRLDGKTPKSLRHEMVKSFNDSRNERARVFLISAKAGGQGINLTGANRVLILDTSWNPSNDQQNIFRIFRLGQKRNCYIYRLLSLGTMEEKVYSRSVTKQAMSFRVVDEHQIDRHYSMAELAELYALTKADYSERPVPKLPQDSILANLLRNHSNLVYKYHEHDSLLENKIEQELSEQEKEDAWLAYERDTNEAAAATVIPPAFTGGFDMFGNINPHNYLSALEAYANNQNDTGFLGLNPAASSPYYSSFGYAPPSPDMLAMYQNAHNFSSSMFGIDPTPHSSLNPQSVASSLLSNSNSRVGPSSNLLPNPANLYYGSGNHSLLNDLSNMHSPHYPSLYSPSTMNPFSTSSAIEMLKKNLESFSSLGSASSSQQSRMHKQHPNTLASLATFPLPYLSNDLRSSSRNSSPTDGIPTSVIMKNDILLKKYNEQLQSMGLNPAGKNSYSSRPMYSTKTTSGVINMETSKQSDNNLLHNLSKHGNNTTKTTNSSSSSSSSSSSTGHDKNISNNNMQRSDKSPINLSSNPSFSITPIPINLDKNKDLNHHDQHSKNSSSMYLMDGLGNINVNKSPPQMTGPENLTNKRDSIGGSKQNNNNTMPTNLGALNYNTSITKSNYNAKQTIGSSPTLINSTEPVSPLNSITISNTTGSNLKNSSQPNIPKQQQQPSIGNDKNNLLTFNDNINQNVVITKLQMDQDQSKKGPNILQSRSKINSDLLETGKTTFRSTAISNLGRSMEQSDQTKYFNSGMSITPVKKTVTGNNTSPYNNNINQNNKSQSHDTQVNQRKRSATTPVRQLSNNSPDSDAAKRHKQNENASATLTKIQMSNKGSEVVQPVSKKNQGTNKVNPTTEIFELD